MIERTLKIAIFTSVIVLVVLAATAAFYIARTIKTAHLLSSALQKLEKADKDLDDRLRGIQEQVDKIDVRTAEVARLAEALQKEEELSHERIVELARRSATLSAEAEKWKRSFQEARHEASEVLRDRSRRLEGDGD